MDLLPLRFEDVGRAYGRRWALVGVDLTVGPGEVVGLWGPNGAGKTTLLRIAAGLEVPTRGRCTWAGRDDRLDDPRARGGLGWVAHGSHLYPLLSARENLALAVKLRGACGLRSRPPRAVLEELGLAEHADRPVRTFSRGMVQRLAIARMLVGTPRLVLLDEPMTALDRTGRAVVTSAIRRLAETGAAVVITSHDPSVHGALAHRVVCLERGRVRAVLDRDERADLAATLLAAEDAPLRAP